MLKCMSPLSPGSSPGSDLGHRGGRQGHSWQDWVIAGLVVALAIFGALTVFSGEIDRLRGKDKEPPKAEGVIVPSGPQQLI
jgi:hypothetical protein